MWATTGGGTTPTSATPTSATNRRSNPRVYQQEAHTTGVQLFGMEAALLDNADTDPVSYRRNGEAPLLQRSSSDPLAAPAATTTTTTTASYRIQQKHGAPPVRPPQLVNGYYYTLSSGASSASTLAAANTTPHTHDNDSSPLLYDDNDCCCEDEEEYAAAPPTQQRRTIFGSHIHEHLQRVNASENSSSSRSHHHHHPLQQLQQPGSSPFSQQQQQQPPTSIWCKAPMSPLTPVSSPLGQSQQCWSRPPVKAAHHHHHHRSSTSAGCTTNNNNNTTISISHHQIQSLLLGLAFAAVWSPSNLMAPVLTDMATTFHLVTNQQRDLYLGSYCSLAVGVLSLPLAAIIGMAADVNVAAMRQRMTTYSSSSVTTKSTSRSGRPVIITTTPPPLQLLPRRHVFAATVAGAALSCWATARCTTFSQLFVARLWSGAFMSGSVPIAFSLLGDLFAPHQRNAASSALTAMMGMGIVLGQVYAGMTTTTTTSTHTVSTTTAVTAGQQWQHAFVVSGAITAVLAVLCFWFVTEPVRGGQEHVLQDMIRATGTGYTRQLNWSSFGHAMHHNASNRTLLWQGFFSSLPWGIVFVFLNDYLSQERGFSVPDATYLVLLFGLGCAAGGILGGYLGQKIQAHDRSYLPLFMAATTLAGIVPFWTLLNTNFTNAHGLLAFLLASSAGMIASLPSVNVRPCLINVNPPETRGASLTAANLLITLGRGLGPSCVTLMGTIFHVNRQYAFNVTVGTNVRVRWTARPFIVCSCR
jgi:MFS family permease